MHAVVTTATFDRHAAAAGLTEDEVMAICTWLSENPQAGVVMSGTGGARKVRFPRRGKGKSGGYRTVHYYAAEDVPVFLLALIDKTRQENLSKAQRNDLAKILPGIANAYRADVKVN